MNESKPTTKTVEQLAVGDWIAPCEISALAAEVLHTLTYPHPGGEGRTHLVLRELGQALPFDQTYEKDHTVKLASEAELEAYRAGAKRAQKIADIRTYADWLENNPSEPVGYGLGGQVDVQGDGTAEAVAKVRAFAARYGATVREELDDRTTARLRFGSVDHVVIAWHPDGRPVEPKPLVSDETIEQAGRMGTWNETEQRWEDPTDPTDSTDLLYTREPSAGDVVLTRPGRGVPPHTSAVTDGGLVDETNECCPEVDCRHPLARHDADGCCLDCHCHPGCSHRPVAGGLVDEDERCPVCGESLREIERGTLGHIPGEACAPVEMAASGLTLAADRSRGVLSGTTPVVTYFSFGHGQTDPSTGAKLLDHYVTVVAPTYEACREAMFASRFGRAWSFDYLAGTARATEWIPQWTEHEVIVAAGTNPTAAQAALQAATDVLTDEMPF